MIAEAIIEKYATALFEIATENKTTSQVALELEAVAQNFGEKSAVQFFISPFNSEDQKVTAAKSSLEGKVSAEVFNFVALLVKNDRIHLIAEINRIFKMKASQVGGQADGVLFVVEEPSADFKAALEKKVSALLKKEVRLKTQTDKYIISGFKVQVEGWTLDDSAIHHIKKLTENISTRGL